MIIPVTPCPAPRQTRSDKWRPRPCVLRYRAFKDHLRLYIKAVPVPLVVHFGIAMPDSWSQKKKKEMNGTPHRQKPDVDNLLKAFLDALLDDDAHVHKVTASKSWAEKDFIIVNCDQSIKEQCESALKTVKSTQV